MILIDPKIKCKVEKKNCDKNGRYRFRYFSRRYANYTCQHLRPKRCKPTNFPAFSKKYNNSRVQEFSEEILVIGGDFNCILAEKDKNGGNTSNRKHLVVEEIKKLCNLYDLSDIWRVLNPNAEEFTWRNKSL